MFLSRWGAGALLGGAVELGGVQVSPGSLVKGSRQRGVWFWFWLADRAGGLRFSAL